MEAREKHQKSRIVNLESDNKALTKTVEALKNSEDIAAQSKLGQELQDMTNVLEEFD